MPITAVTTSHTTNTEPPDGTGLAVRRLGQGVPVVMVHGSAGGLDSWNDVTRLLAGEFEVWMYARRGYAPSGKVRGEEDLR